MMKTTLHRMITKDGLELVGLLYEPASTTKKILVHVHGMGGNFYENRFLDAIANNLTDEGIAFFTFNNRGCETFKDLTKIVDGKTELVRIGSAYEKFEDCILDIEAALDIVSRKGFEIIHLSGHSLGSPKVAYYISETKDPRIASVIFMSPADMLGLVRAEKEIFDRDFTEAKDMVSADNGDHLLSHLVWDEYPISAGTYLSLFGPESKAGIFNLYDPSDKFEVLGKIAQPVLAIMGRKDDALVVPIEETMERISKAAVNSAKAETKILGDANHGYDGFEDELADIIGRWVTKII